MATQCASLLTTLHTEGNPAPKWAYIYAFKWGSMVKIGQSVDPSTHYSQTQNVTVKEFLVFEPPTDVGGYVAERLVQRMALLMPCVLAADGYRGRREREWYSGVSFSDVVRAFGTAKSLLGGSIFMHPGKPSLRARTTPFPNFTLPCPPVYSSPSDYLSRVEGILRLACDVQGRVLVACEALGKYGRSYADVLKAPLLADFRKLQVRQVFSFPTLGAATACADCVHVILSRQGLGLGGNLLDHGPDHRRSLRAFVFKPQALTYLGAKLGQVAVALGSSKISPPA